MKRSVINRCHAWIAPLLLLFASAPAAGQEMNHDPWLTQVMPRSEQLVLRGGDLRFVRSAHSEIPPPPASREAWLGEGQSNVIYELEWPVTVQRREGQWLWLKDNSNYRSRPIKGWVNVDDVIKVEDAVAHYTEQITARPYAAALYYWLRGRCLEVSQRDIEAAKADYHAAAALSGPSPAPGELPAPNTSPVPRFYNPNMAMASLHIGRILAGEQVSDPQGGQTWAQRLHEARLNLSPHDDRQRLVDLLIGDGHRTVYGVQPEVSQFTNAYEQYFKAGLPNLDDDSAMIAQASPGALLWPQPCYGCGALLLKRAQHLKKGSSKAAEVPDAMWNDALKQLRGRWVENKAEKTLDESTPPKWPKACDTSGNLQLAIKYFNHAIAMNPGYVEAHNDRATAYLALASEGTNPDDRARKSNLKLALQSVQRACMLTYYSRSEPLGTLAEVCATMGNHRDAAQYAKQAAEYIDDPAKQSQWINRAKAYTLADAAAILQNMRKEDRDALITKLKAESRKQYESEIVENLKNFPLQDIDQIAKGSVPDSSHVAAEAASTEQVWKEAINRSQGKAMSAPVTHFDDQTLNMWRDEPPLGLGPFVPRWRSAR